MVATNTSIIELDEEQSSATLKMAVELVRDDSGELGVGSVRDYSLVVDAVDNYSRLLAAIR